MFFVSNKQKLLLIYPFIYLSYIYSFDIISFSVWFCKFLPLFVRLLIILGHFWFFYCSFILFHYVTQPLLMVSFKLNIFLKVSLKKNFWTMHFFCFSVNVRVIFNLVTSDYNLSTSSSIHWTVFFASLGWIHSYLKKTDWVSVENQNLYHFTNLNKKFQMLQFQLFWFCCWFIKTKFLLLILLCSFWFSEGYSSFYFGFYCFFLSLFIKQLLLVKSSIESRSDNSSKSATPFYITAEIRNLFSSV